MFLRKCGVMADIEIRTATPFDAEELLGIYSYYIINTAVTYELEVPSAEDFSRSSAYRSVGKLIFAACACREGCKNIEYLSRKNASAEYGEV